MKLQALIASLAALAAASPASAAIVNLGADLGFTYDTGGSDPAPVAGEHINFIGPVPTLSLAAGTYRVTNATGLAGANPNYTAWSYNLGTNSWAWGFVAATASGSVITYGDSGVGGSSQASVASAPAVQNFSTTFTLAAPTVVAFTLRDYYVPDNGGGEALNIQPFGASAVPEPAVWSLMIVGLAMAGGALRRRREALTTLVA